MITNVLTTSVLRPVDAAMYAQAHRIPLCIVTTRGEQRWMNTRGRDPRSDVIPVVFASLSVFLAQRDDMHQHALRYAALVLCSPDELTSFGLPACPHQVWNNALFNDLLRHASPCDPMQLANVVRRDLVQEAHVLADYPAGKVMRDVHSILYRITDKVRRAQVQQECWAWLGGMAKTKPMTGFAPLQKRLDSPEALVLRAAVIYNRTHSMHDTREAFPTVDEFALNFLHHTLNPKKKAVPTTKKR